MLSKFLPVFQENADLGVQEAVPLLEARRLDFEGIQALCTDLRRRGLCALFRGSTPEVLLADLQRSGAAFAFFLGSFDERRALTSRAAPLFDAIGAGDRSSARVIARLSRATWNEGEEYEDDFLYARLIGRLLFDAPEGGDTRAFIDRYEIVLEGAPDARLAVVRSLLDRDAQAFEESLGELLTAHEDRYREGMEQEYIPEEQWATEGQIFIEGLALLRLASLRGVPAKKGYPFIPSNVLRKTASSFDPYSWRG